MRKNALENNFKDIILSNEIITIKMMHSFLLCNINNGTSTNYIPNSLSLELEGHSEETAMGTENLLFLSGLSFTAADNHPRSENRSSKRNFFL